MFSSLIVDGLEFQESRVHYTLAGIKSLLKVGEGGSLAREGGGGVQNPWNPPLATPLRHLTVYSVVWTSIFSSRVRLVLLDNSYLSPNPTFCPKARNQRPLFLNISKFILVSEA